MSIYSDGKSLSAQVYSLEYEVGAAKELIDELGDDLEATQKTAEYWHEKYAQEQRRANDLQKALKRQRDTIRDLRDGRDRWNAETTDRVPRVVTADELRLGAGQWIAYQDYNDNKRWLVESYDKEAFGPCYQDTIVLLADAPEPELRGESIRIPEVRKGDVLDGYFWDITPGGVDLHGAVCTRDTTDADPALTFIEVEQDGHTYQVAFSSIDVELRLVHRSEPEPEPEGLTVEDLDAEPVTVSKDQCQDLSEQLAIPRPGVEQHLRAAGLRIEGDDDD